MYDLLLKIFIQIGKNSIRGKIIQTISDIRCEKLKHNQIYILKPHKICLTCVVSYFNSIFELNLNINFIKYVTGDF